MRRDRAAYEKQDQVTGIGSLTANQWNTLCGIDGTFGLLPNTGRGYNGSRPLLLNHKSALLDSFVYDRKFGVFPCAYGAHKAVMSLLLAWHHGCENGHEVAELFNMQYPAETAVEFLMREGTALRPSQMCAVVVWHRENLNERETACFKHLHCVVEVSSQVQLEKQAKQ